MRKHVCACKLCCSVVVCVLHLWSVPLQWCDGINERNVCHVPTKPFICWQWWDVSRFLETKAGCRRQLTYSICGRRIEKIYEHGDGPLRPLPHHTHATVKSNRISRRVRMTAACTNLTIKWDIYKNDMVALFSRCATTNGRRANGLLIYGGWFDREARDPNAIWKFKFDYWIRSMGMGSACLQRQTNGNK